MQSLPSERRPAPPSLATRPAAKFSDPAVFSDPAGDLPTEDEVTVKVGSTVSLAGARTDRAHRILTVARPAIEGFDDEPTAIFRPRTFPKAPTTHVVFDDDEPTTLWKSAPSTSVLPSPTEEPLSLKPAAERTMRAADVRSALADALRALS